jgi:hypothetical protein
VTKEEIAQQLISDQEAAMAYTRQRLREDSFMRKFMPSTILNPAPEPIRGFFVIRHDPDYYITFEGIKIHGKEVQPWHGRLHLQCK